MTKVSTEKKPATGLKIAIVIVTYHAPAGMLEAAVDSVLSSLEPDSSPAGSTSPAGTCQHNTTIEVVDNGDQARRRLNNHSDRIRITTTGHNTGFAAAVNTGFRRAVQDGAEFLVCLNDDITVGNGWLAPLVAALDADPMLGGVQPLLVSAADGTIDGAGVEIDRFGAGSDRLRGQDPVTASMVEVDAVTGGAAMFRSAFFRDIGPMDERFFLYYEDVEWCRRGAQKGWKFAVVPESVVNHQGSATTSDLGDGLRLLQDRNRLWNSAMNGSRQEFLAGLWLSVRRLRHPPRQAHRRALLRGIQGSAARLTRRASNRWRLVGGGARAPRADRTRSTRPTLGHHRSGDHSG